MTSSRIAGPAEGPHDPAVVAPQVEGDDDVALLEQGDVAHDDDLVAIEQGDAVPEACELVGELCGDSTGCLPRQHPHLAARVGQQVDRRPERGRVDALQRLVHVVELDRQAAPEEVGRRRLPDALCGRAQLAPQLPLHRFLQPGEAVVAELGRQAHHRGGTRSGLARQVGDRPEGDELRVLQHHVRHPALGRRQPPPASVIARATSTGPDASCRNGHSERVYDWSDGSDTSGRRGHGEHDRAVADDAPTGAPRPIRRAALYARAHAAPLVVDARGERFDLGALLPHLARRPGLRARRRPQHPPAPRRRARRADRLRRRSPVGRRAPPAGHSRRSRARHAAAPDRLPGQRRRQRVHAPHRRSHVWASPSATSPSTAATSAEHPAGPGHRGAGRSPPPRRSS